jgi:transposase
VRKVIRSEATEFRYEREAQPLPKIGPWSDKLDQLLLANEGKVSRERLTLIRLFEELRGCGYGRGYDAVRRYARRWSKERGATTAAAYVPLSFAPGEAYQFDWSHEVVLLNGATVTVTVAHVRLCHSRMLFVRLIRARRRRWCSTPTRTSLRSLRKLDCGHLPCSKAHASAASTTT